jgi:hypothetical protein
MEALVMLVGFVLLDIAALRWGIKSCRSDWKL